MPINEIRDTLSANFTTDASGRGYLTRRVNLPENFRHQLLAVDVFNDDLGVLLTDGPGGPVNTGYQFFISPFPCQYTDEDWGPLNQTINSGPMAGDEQVLYKEALLTKNAILNSPNNVLFSQFPNPQVGAIPTSTWYSNHVYFTLMYYGEPETNVTMRFSVYMKVKQTKSNATTISMGSYKEFLDAQARLLTETAVMMNPLDVPGYTFPMWKYGGIRPELMITGTTALRYFNRVASNANQEMTTRAELETALKSSTRTVDFDQAFGDATLNLPEWISLMDVAGVTSGPIRQYPPPLKFADNGNTLMF